MERCRVAFWAVCVVVVSTVSVAADEPRAVVELFTSQGCSSCPAADRLLGELSKDQTLVAMTLPIDYWDYLGWKDTLAKPKHTARQRAYAHERGDRAVYTPQVVVNGLAHVQGSDKAAIETAIARTRRTPGTAAVPVRISVSGERVEAVVAAGSGVPSGAELWLCALVKRIPVAIGRGENRGREVTYHNVVRNWIKLGDWNGAAVTFSKPVSEIANDDINAVAVVLQAGDGDRPGRMLGAATASLR
jgi:hypothetical protein